MKTFPINTIMITITFGLIFGILAQSQVPISIVCIYLLCALGILSILFCLFFKRLMPFAVFFSSFFVGELSYYVHYHPNNSIHYTKKVSDKESHIFQGIIQQVNTSTAIVKLQMSDNEPVTGDVLLYFKQGEIDYKNIGNQIIFHSKLSPIGLSKNPYQFDYKFFMNQRNVFWYGSLSKEEFQIKTSFQEYSWVLKARKLQYDIASSLDKYSFSQVNKGIIKALILGLRQEVDFQMKQDYIDAGVIHILAISGLHIGMISLFLSMFFKILFASNRLKWLRILLHLFIIWGYAFFTGLSPSVCRACAMFSLLSFASEFNRKQGIYDNIILSIWILLLLNPMFIFEIGFQLSYLAVWSIVTFFPIFRRHFKSSIIQIFYDIFAISISAQIGVIPISLWYFHQFSGLFFISNLLILPFLGVILLIGLVIVLLSYIGVLPKFLVESYDLLLTILNRVIAKIASFDAFVFKDLYFDKKLFLFISIAILSIAIYLYRRKNIKFLFVCLLSLLSCQISLLTDKLIVEKPQWLILHQFKNSVVALVSSHQLSVFYKVDKPLSLVASIKQNKLIYEVNYFNLNDIMPFNDDYLLHLDGSWLPDKKFSKVKYLLLSNGSDFYLNRVLDVISPKVVIADANVSISRINLWKRTCEQKNILFHSTTEKGYFSIN